jgi:hypothetical protein
MTYRQPLDSKQWAERAKAGGFVPAHIQILLDEIGRKQEEIRQIKTEIRDCARLLSLLDNGMDSGFT